MVVTRCQPQQTDRPAIPPRGRQRPGPWTRAKRDPAFLRRFAASYTGRHAPLDALWWLENPDRPTPDGRPSPAVELQRLRATIYQRDASVGATTRFQIESDALTDDTERARRALTLAESSNRRKAPNRRTVLISALLGTATAAVLMSLALGGTQAAHPFQASETPPSPPTTRVQVQGPAPSFSIPNVYAHYRIRPPGQLLVVSTATAQGPTIELPLKIPAGATYFTIIWRCKPDSTITWRLTRGTQTVQEAREAPCVPDLQNVIKARVGRADPTDLRIQLASGVRYSFAIYYD